MTEPAGSTTVTATAMAKAPHGVPAGGSLWLATTRSVLMLLRHRERSLTGGSSAYNPKGTRLRHALQKSGLDEQLAASLLQEYRDVEQPDPALRDLLTHLSGLSGTELRSLLHGLLRGMPTSARESGIALTGNPQEVLPFSSSGGSHQDTDQMALAKAVSVHAWWDHPQPTHPAPAPPAGATLADDLPTRGCLAAVFPAPSTAPTTPTSTALDSLPDAPPVFRVPTTMSGSGALTISLRAPAPGSVPAGPATQPSTTSTSPTPTPSLALLDLVSEGVAASLVQRFGSSASRSPLLSITFAPDGSMQVSRHSKQEVYCAHGLGHLLTVSRKRQTSLVSMSEFSAFLQLTFRQLGDVFDPARLERCRAKSTATLVFLGAGPDPTQDIKTSLARASGFDDCQCYVAVQSLPAIDAFNRHCGRLIQALSPVQDVVSTVDAARPRPQEEMQEGEDGQGEQARLKMPAADPQFGAAAECGETLLRRSPAAAQRWLEQQLGAALKGLFASQQARPTDTGVAAFLCGPREAFKEVAWAQGAPPPTPGQPWSLEINAAATTPHQPPQQQPSAVAVENNTPTIRHLSGTRYSLELDGFDDATAAVLGRAASSVAASASASLPKSFPRMRRILVTRDEISLAHRPHAVPAASDSTGADTGGLAYTMEEAPTVLFSRPSCARRLQGLVMHPQDLLDPAVFTAAAIAAHCRVRLDANHSLLLIPHAAAAELRRLEQQAIRVFKLDQLPSPPTTPSPSPTPTPSPPAPPAPGHPPATGPMAHAAAAAAGAAPRTSRGPQPNTTTPQQSIEALVQYGELLSRRGLALYDQGRYREAMRCHEQHLALLVALRDHRGVGVALGNLGNCALGQGDYKRAVAWHERHCAMSLAIGDDTAMAAACGNQAVACCANGDYDRATRLHALQLDVCHNVTYDLMGEGKAHGGLGNVCFALRQHEEAIRHHKAHAAICRARGDRVNESSALCRLGNVLMAMDGPDNLAQAKGYFQQYRQLCEAAGDRVGEAKARSLIGVVLTRQRDFPAALACHRELLDRYTSIGDVHGLAIGHANCGVVLHLNQEYAPAIHHLTLAVRYFAETSDTQNAIGARCNLGFALCDAASASTPARGTADTPSATTKNQKQQQQEGRALEVLAQAMESADAFRQSRDGAAQGQQGQLALLEQQAVAFGAMQTIFAARADPASALAAAERSRARLLCESLASKFGVCPDAPSGTSEPDGAVALATSLQSTILYYSLVPVREAARAHEDEYTLLVWAFRPRRPTGQGPDRQFLATKIRIGRLVALLNETRRQLRVPTKDLAPPDLGAHLDSYGLGPCQDWLRAHVSCSDYDSFEAALEALGCAKGHLDQLLADYPLAPELEALLREGLARALAETRRDIAPLQELYELLVAPVEAMLPEAPDGPVVVVPHGVLYMCPFNALQRPSDGVFLIERFLVTTTPSLSALRALSGLKEQQQPLVGGQCCRGEVAQSDGHGRRALVIGASHPAPCNGIQYPMLPGAEREARAVARILDAECLVNGDATVAATLAALPQAASFHVAGHGVGDQRAAGRGLNGGVLLADGLLASQDIAALDLRATQFATLAACNTGDSRQRLNNTFVFPAEGVLGVTQACMVAGIPTCVAAMWTLDDSVSARVMSRTYSFMVGPGGQTLAAALRRACLELLHGPHRARREARHWAPYTVVGFPCSGAGLSPAAPPE